MKCVFHICLRTVLYYKSVNRLCYLCKVIETKSLMGHVVNGLSDLVPKVQVAAIRCLHSLSRSVRQLRTSFQDQEVWKPIRPVRLLIFAFYSVFIL